MFRKKNSYTEVVMSGGVGNQMFQYAFYLTLVSMGRRVKLNTALYSFLEMHNGIELERCFNIPISSKNSKLGVLLIRLLVKFKLTSVALFDPLSFESNVFQSNVKYLIGYWQSEKYFIQIKEEITSVFKFSGVNEGNLKLADEMNNCNSVAIHIRRGDYVNNSHYVDLCNSQYYSNAIDLLRVNFENNTELRFFVFSNDLEFSERFFRYKMIDVVVVEINRGRESYLDMYLMSNCKHNIIANSTFSWWGAWLNKNPEKIVIAPDRWMNTLDSDTYHDIVPLEWHKVSVS